LPMVLQNFEFQTDKHLSQYYSSTKATILSEQK